MTQKNKVLEILIIVALILIIVVTGNYIFRRLYSINRLDSIISYRNKIQDIISRNHAPLSIENVNLIDTWMTFNYINTIFKLPADYLKNDLNISDKRYPNISLSGYTKNNQLDETVFLDAVRKAVADYFTAK